MKSRLSLHALPLAFLLLAAPACTRAQQQAVTPEGTLTNSRQAAGPPPALETIPPVNSGKSAQVLQQEHDALVADTEKLAVLVNELKAELTASNGTTLSVTSVKKAAEIEKLSRSIKNRLKS